jgi:hypothetical protein
LDLCDSMWGLMTCVRQFSWPITVPPLASIACRGAGSAGSPCRGLFHRSATSISLRNHTKSSPQWLGS